MPYKRTYRKRNYRKRQPKKSYVQKVAREEAKKAVKVQAEHKYFDSITSATQIDWSGTNAVFNMTYNPLSTANITQGTDDVNYIGKKIRLVFLTIRGKLTIADTTNMMRCIILQTKTNNTPTLAGVLQSVGNVRAPLAPYERQFNDQWNIIRDKTYIMDQVRNSIVYFKIKIPSTKFRQMAFSNASGTIEKGGIYMCWISDSGVASHPILEYYSRLTFTDA